MIGKYTDYSEFYGSQITHEKALEKLCAILLPISRDDFVVGISKVNYYLRHEVLKTSQKELEFCKPLFPAAIFQKVSDRINSGTKVLHRQQLLFLTKLALSGVVCQGTDHPIKHIESIGGCPATSVRTLETRS